MPEKNDIPIFRNLDGVYYRVIRDGIHVNRCFLICPKPSRM